MEILVFDSAPLSCFARARQLPLLERLTEGWDRVTPPAVLDELRDGIAKHPELKDATELRWLRVVSTDSLDVLRLFMLYAELLGSSSHDLGEAAVLAYAERHGAIAFSDDEGAVRSGRARKVTVQRTLSLIARGVRLGTLSETDGDQLVQDLVRAGARFPCAPHDFLPWARAKGLLGQG